MEEQATACLNCGHAEKITQDSPRLAGRQWPAWKPGVQSFPCPNCGEELVWATETREVVDEP